MPAPATIDEFVAMTRQSGLIEADPLKAALDQLQAADALPHDPKELARTLVEQGLLTYFQAGQLLQGKWRGFNLGKYLILERLGAGGMGIVYLAEHKLLHRRVALKVLPLSMACDPWFLELFYHEAQAVAALAHPNIVHAHDIDQDGKLHFLVMEYVDGASLQEIVRKHGPMEPVRVAHYLRQAALGLQHAHEAGLVHRDIKPANLLLDRRGTIKILDMGLAQFFQRKQVETNNNNNNGKKARVIVGTDDYLAPEQIVDSDDVDIRADIYGLGSTGYFLLTGNPPFHHLALEHHKFISHLMQHPRPLRELCPEVPEDLAAVITRMMAKNPWDRYRVPVEVVRALAPWTQTPIPPPPEAEMPDLSPAARRGALEASPSSASRRVAGKSSWVICGETQATAVGSKPAAGASPSDASPADSARISLNGGTH
jgi:serine/threonine protein kinase